MRHDAEQARRDMEPKSLVRRGVEPGSSPRQGQEAEVGTGGFTARCRRKQLRDHCTVESLGQLALSGRRRHWDTQVVRRQDSLVVSSDGSKERGMRGQIIGAIKAQASGGGASKGSYVGSRRVSMGEAQPQTTDRGCEGGLAPGLRREGACADAFQAGADLSIKGLQGIGMHSRWSHSQGIGHTAKRSAVTEEQERSLNVRQSGKLLQKGFINTLNCEASTTFKSGQ